MKSALMKSLGYFLSGNMVRDATLKAMDGFFEKRAEPHYRRKATEGGFAEDFERYLIEWRQRGADHASLRAFKWAKHRHNEA